MLKLFPLEDLSGVSQTSYSVYFYSATHPHTHSQFGKYIAQSSLHRVSCIFARILCIHFSIAMAASSESAFRDNYEKAMLHAKLQAMTYENQMMRRLIKHLVGNSMQPRVAGPASSSTSVPKSSFRGPLNERNDKESASMTTMSPQSKPKEDFSGVVFTHADFADYDGDDANFEEYDKDDEEGYYDENGEYQYYEEDDYDEEYWGVEGAEEDDELAGNGDYHVNDVDVGEGGKLPERFVLEAYEAASKGNYGTFCPQVKYFSSVN